MPRTKKPSPTFMKYVAVRDKHDPDIIDIGTPESYRSDLGLGYRPVCRINVEDRATWEALRWSTLPRAWADEIVAQADSLLGIVIRVERYLNQQKAEAPTT